MLENINYTRIIPNHRIEQRTIYIYDVLEIDLYKLSFIWDVSLIGTYKMIAR